MGILFRDTDLRLQNYQKLCYFTIFLKLKMIESLFFIWAARLPPVAVGLSALLRYARARSYPCISSSSHRIPQN